MNAHPHSVQLATEPEAPALPDAARFAQNLMQAAKILVPVFEAGRSIDAAALRAAMEDACGASDTDGWVGEQLQARCTLDRRPIDQA